jgi:hypothetical protein
MRILLDIDDTAILTRDRGNTWNEHPRLLELISKHEVYLYSGNPNIERYYRQWKTRGYIPKSADYRAEADVLIDNDYKLWRECVDVGKCYSSIDRFFRHQPK